MGSLQKSMRNETFQCCFYSRFWQEIMKIYFNLCIHLVENEFKKKVPKKNRRFARRFISLLFGIYFFLSELICFVKITNSYWLCMANGLRINVHRITKFKKASDLRYFACRQSFRAWHERICVLFYYGK